MASLLAGFFGSFSNGGVGPAAGGGGTPSSSSSNSGGNTTRAPTYSFPLLQQLYDKLSRFRESDLEKGGGDAVVETVRQITEAVIWGEQNNPQFFDFFCEKNILSDFVRVLGLAKAPKKVKMQLLQTLSMLVQNIRRQTSVYYLLSNNHVNRLMATTPLDFNDEEILAYYITLMKSLAMRLDSETIKFFFIHHPEPTFPLYIEATKFFAHRDQMVRATVRTITLQVYQIEDQPMRRFVLRHAAESYFSQLAFHLRDLWLRLDAAAVGLKHEEDLAAVRRENELQQDLQIYLSDVFQLEVAELNEVLADRLLNCAMLPLLLSGVIGSTPASGNVDMDSGVRQLAPSVALFLIRQVFDTFHSPVLLEPLASALLLPLVPAALAYVLPPCPEPSPQRVDCAHPVSHLEGDFVPNALRGYFLRGLQSSEDTIFLLTAAVVHGCVQNRRAVPAPFLESAGLCLALGVPASVSSSQPSRSSPRTEPKQQAGSLQPMVLLLQALRCFSTWQLATLHVLLRILGDIVINPSLRSPALPATLRTVYESMLQAAMNLRSLLQESSKSDSPDWLLDTVAEEWELQKAPPPDVGSFCADPRRLLPGSAWDVAPQRGPAGRRTPAELEARNAVRRLLLLRRHLAELERSSSALSELVGAGGATAEAREASRRVSAPGGDDDSPLRLEAQVTGTFQEGMSFDIGSIDRIVCGVSAPGGKRTRYLLLHDFWLVLVQPDLASPGWAVVTTTWPIWQVVSLIDRGDPRTLHLAMQSHGGAVQPGEAVAYNTAASGYYTLTLNFEDWRRCHAADAHLQRRRRTVRGDLLQQVAAFVDSCVACPRPACLAEE